MALWIQAGWGHLREYRPDRGDHFYQHTTHKTGTYSLDFAQLPSPDRIHEGVRRLASVIETEIQLRDDFGPAPGIR